MRLIRPPEPLPRPDDRPAVFLAGSIEQDRAPRWQDRIVEALAGEDVIVLNPRRAAWDATWRQELADPRFAEQVDWELAGLDRADLIACYLAPETQAPVSLLECGLHMRGGKLIVACPPGFHRRGNIEATCRRYSVPFLDDLDELISTCLQRLANWSPS